MALLLVLWQPCSSKGKEQEVAVLLGQVMTGSRVCVCVTMQLCELKKPLKYNI